MRRVISALPAMAAITWAALSGSVEAATGVPVVISFPDSPQSAAFNRVAEEVARQVSIEAMKPELVVISRAT